MKIRMKSDLLEQPITVSIEKIIDNKIFVQDRGVFELDHLSRISHQIEVHGQSINEYLMRPDLENNIFFGQSDFEELKKSFFNFRIGESVYWDIAGSYLTGRVVHMKGKRVQVQEDKIVKDNSNGQLSIQPDPQGRIHIFGLRKSGVWRMAHITDHKSSLYRGGLYD